jgi:hypothetical protein
MKELTLLNISHYAYLLVSHALAQELHIDGMQSHSSAANIATVYKLDGQGVGVRVPLGSRPALRPTQPPTQKVPGLSSQGVKLTTSTNSAEVKKTSIYTLHGIVLRKLYLSSPLSYGIQFSCVKLVNIHITKCFFFMKQDMGLYFGTQKMDNSPNPILMSSSCCSTPPLSLYHYH